MTKRQAQQRQTFLGCVADDITGATDLAINLVQGGMRVVQILGVPRQDELEEIDADAIVVALKTRAIKANEAITESVAAIESLKQHGCRRFVFKYCSTFDSTEQGNIGPVAEAIMKSLEVKQTIFCPAFPRNGRTVFQGHLFVGNKLLNESGMENHPLNPMVDANLVRCLSEQTQGNAGLLDYACIEKGVDSVRGKLAELMSAGNDLVITDSCDDSQLQTLAAAAAHMRFITGGSGIARFLPDAYREIGELDSSVYQPDLPNVPGRELVISGSCSSATLRQVASMKPCSNHRNVSAAAVLADHAKELESIVNWAESTEHAKPLMLYSSASPEKVARTQQQYGAETVAIAIEQFHGAVAKALVEKVGVRRIIVAGGETSGAVAASLNVRILQIGPEICTGVPWTETFGERHLALAFKSGNFGDEDFFMTALGMLN